MGLTPAPFHAWPLAWLALIPLWLLIHPSRPAGPINDGYRLLLAGCWGLGYHGLALFWITGLHPLMWMGIPWLGSIAIAAFAWVFITLWGTAIGGSWMLGMSLLRPWLGNAMGRLLVGTALWCAIESLWSRGPLWWTSLAYTQSPYNLPILHLGQLSGPLLVTAAIVVVNGLLAEAIAAVRWPQSRLNVSRWGGTAIALLLVAHLLGGWLYSQPLVEPAETALRVGLIQGNIPTREKLTRQGVLRAYQIYLNGYESLAARGVDAVATPEGALPTVWDPSVQARSPIYQAVLENRVALWLGTFAKASNAAEAPLTQSLFAIAPDGETVGRYNKVKLVPLGEYIPLASLLGQIIGRLSPIDSSLSPGSFGQRFETSLGLAAVGICYESPYSQLFRQQVADGGRFILTASNNDPYPPRMMAQHHAQDLMRAIETDRWAVRVTNTGLSGIVDPHGHTRWLSEPNQYVTHIATIYRRQTRTLYVRWGDWLTPLLGGLGLVWLVWQGFKGRLQS
ncbi:apolipoprotein N-acyltransferase [Romeria aff. gracilis LEGE 07310]|uniref:Apolipoprotein N-acyltransferase n=2 Tax=Vasconcelosia TaxID=3366328 RepID=A0A8J7AQ27_9CYAN|nr:apolipoprotein N-acyltransferase [Romeria aff. gracilis LEGE 07310]